MTVGVSLRGARTADTDTASKLQLVVKHHVPQAELLLDLELAQLGDELDVLVLQRDRVGSRESERQDEVGAGLLRDGVSPS